MATSVVRRLYEKRKVLRIMVQRDLKVRYAQSFLGYIWTILDPLLMSMIYFVVFSLIFQRGAFGHQPYIMFLLTGMLPWQWFNGAVSEAARSLQAEAKLIRSTRLPRELWVLRVVISKCLEYVFSLPILVGFGTVFLIRGELDINWRLVLLPVGMAIQFVLLVGIGLLLSPILVLVNDMNRIIRIGLRMVFYATPIIYTLDRAPGVLQTILWFNPMTGILEFYRSGFFGVPLQLEPILISVAITVAMLFLGRLVFKRLEPTVLKEI